MPYNAGSARGQSYLGTRASNPINITYLQRDPTVTDTNYKLGDHILNTETETIWYLASLAGNSTSKGEVADWVQIGGTGGGTIRFDADSGFAEPAADIINLKGDPNITTSGDSTNNLEVSLNDDVLIDGFFEAQGNISSATGNIIASAGNITATLGTVTAHGNVTTTQGDVAIDNGDILFSAVSNPTKYRILWAGLTGIDMDGVGNTLIGLEAGNLGDNNTALGRNALEGVTGHYNVGIGSASGSGLTTGSSNVLIGDATSIKTGSNNTMIGNETGSNYTGSESDNILIGAKVSGTVSESYTLRIGAGTGTGDGMLETAYVSGIYGNVLAGNVQVVSIAPDDQLGSINPDVAGYVLTSNGPFSAPSFKPSTGGGGGGGGGYLTTVFSTPGSDTFTKDANAEEITVYMWGGGGGGGTPNNVVFAGDGGGGGGFLKYTFPASSFDAIEDVIVGAGGLGSTVFNTFGQPGGDSSIGFINPDNGGVAGGIGTQPTQAPALVYVEGSLSVGVSNSPYAGSVTSPQGGRGGRGGISGRSAREGSDTGFSNYSASGLNFMASQIAAGGGGAGIQNNAGALGGSIKDFSTTSNILVSGGNGGTAGGGNGSNGLPTFDLAGNFLYTGFPWSGGTGGGGGGSNTSGAPGKGGNGGFPGGGGGGGAAGATNSNFGFGGNGANGLIIVIEKLGSGGTGLFWKNLTTDGPHTPVSGNGYITSGVGLGHYMSIKLPLSPAIGFVFSVVGGYVGGAIPDGQWIINQNAADRISGRTGSSTPGIGGSVSSVNSTACLTLVFIGTSSGQNFWTEVADGGGASFVWV